MVNWKKSIIEKSTDVGSFNIKLTFDFTDDGLSKDECEYLINKTKEFVANNNQYKFDYYPSCIGVNNPKKVFRTVLAIDLNPKTSDEEYNSLAIKLEKEFKTKFVEYYLEQKKQFNDNF